jgi:hypothetical protein
MSDINKVTKTELKIPIFTSSKKNNSKMPQWYDVHYANLDKFFKEYEWNWNLPKFFDGFFDQDRTWVAGALKAVLPAGRLTDAEISEVAYSLWGYAQHNTLDLDKARDRRIIMEQSLQNLQPITNTD